MYIHKLGVRERLCAAFAIIGLLPIVSAGVAWVAFAHMDHAITDIARDKLPQIEGSLAVARRADLLVSDGYQLLDSSTENDRKSRAAAVADASSGAVALLKKLRDDGSNLEAVSAIESRLADLNKTLGRADAVVGQSIGVQSRLSELPKRVADLNAKLTGALRPLVIERGNRTTGLIGEMSSPAATLDERTAAAKAMKELGYVSVALATIGQSAAHLQTAFVQTALAANDAALVPIQGAIGREIEAMAVALDDLDDESRAILEPFVAEFDSLAKENWIALRRQGLAADSARASVIGESRIAAAGLNDSVAANVALAKAQVSQASASATETIVNSRRLLLGTAIMGLLLAGLVGWLYVERNIGRRLVALERSMRRIADGDLQHVGAPSGSDEVGRMADALEIFRANAVENQTLHAEQQASEQRAASQRKADMQKLADAFEDTVGKIIQAVSSAAGELEVSANTLTSTAEKTEGLSGVVASAAGEASDKVQSVAAASEQMTSSVNEISRQVHDSSVFARQAVEQAQKTDDLVGMLSKAASRIGDVVELISTIASQTNLLALNATIEAARAGDAGRGFAVVASEVKALAQQTAKATDEITQQINDIQSATQESVVSIREIGVTIGRMSAISSTVASSVEEQGAAMQEISRNVQHAANGATQVASNIVDVQRGSNETRSASSTVLGSAQILSGESSRLKAEVRTFLATVRAS
jgi:methyl-accepting chemotaxis protein